MERCATAQAAAALLRRLAARLPTQELCVRCRFDEDETIFVLCTREITPGRRLGHATLLSQLPDCEKPLREALAGATRIRSLAQMDACQALLESVQLEMCVARASQAIDFGSENTYRRHASADGNITSLCVPSWTTSPRCMSLDANSPRPSPGVNLE